MQGKVQVVRGIEGSLMFLKCGELGVVIKDKVYRNWIILGFRDYVICCGFYFKNKEQ